MNDKITKKILIAASGTGGHIFPALSFSNTILEDSEFNYEINFIGTGRELEKKLIDPNFKRHQYKISGVSKPGILGLLRFLWQFPKAFFAVWGIIRTFKPQLIMGFGGYASVLPLFIGFLCKIPTIIFETEKKAGLANKFIAKFCTKIAVAYEKVEGLNSNNQQSKIEFVGKVLRPSMLKFLKEKESIGDKNIFIDIANKDNKDCFNILIMGGSQGADSLDKLMLKIVDTLKNQKIERKIIIWHQCRKENQVQLQNFYLANNIEAKVVTFIDCPEDAYRWAHLAISRAGALSAMELALANIPTVFIPLPKAIEQFDNAKMLEDYGYGKMFLEEDGVDNLQLKTSNFIIEMLVLENYTKMQLNKKKLDLPISGAKNLTTLALAILKKTA